MTVVDIQTPEKKQQLHFHTSKIRKLYTFLQSKINYTCMNPQRAVHIAYFGGCWWDVKTFD